MMRRPALRTCLSAALLTTAASFTHVAAAADAKRYYPAEPADAPTYTLPDPLVRSDGRPVTSAAEWMTSRRPEILELFRTHVYGRVPATAYQQTAKIVSEDANVFGGRATRKDVDVTITAQGKSLVIHLVLFTPNGVSRPVPAFLLMGNSSVDKYDPTKAPPSNYWPVEHGISRGYAMAAFWSWDVDPDQKTDTDFKDGIHALLDVGPRRPDAWATLSAWAWGMSRCLDYLVTNPAIAGDKVAVVGHSRAGKTALWAAAQDERFAMACSNDSGCGGAALSRHRTKEKETVAMINKLFPHWFAESFKGFNGREEALPIDQHELIALIAPRNVCVASADQDPWADPRGEFLSVVAAEPVFRLLGRKGLGGVREMPAIDEPLHGEGLHYHIRTGKHALARSDWDFYFGAADRAFGITPPAASSTAR